MEAIVLVHGGAGAITEEDEPFKLEGVKKAAKAGYQALQLTGNGLDAIESAIHVMEDDEHFNAGNGSVLNSDGEVEMDASIMVGKTLEAGACSIVRTVRYPITFPIVWGWPSPIVGLSSQGCGITKANGGEYVKRYFCTRGISFFVPALDALWKTLHIELIDPERRKKLSIRQSKANKLDTVGCVVIDSNGNLFAGTSTGGISGKMPGRVSDSSQLGSGNYADNDFGAVSMTGNGEAISKFVMAHSIIKEIQNGKSAQEAAEFVVNLMYEKLGKEAGSITISNNGDIGIAFSSNQMPWAYQKGNELHFGIYPNEDETETVLN